VIWGSWLLSRTLKVGIGCLGIVYGHGFPNQSAPKNNCKSPPVTEALRLSPSSTNFWDQIHVEQGIEQPMSTSNIQQK